jgi:trehalose 6-phosphate synthase/phosphatase
LSQALQERYFVNLVLVSNRLPVTVIQNDGELKFEKSAGGLVSGLSAYLDSLRSSPLAGSRYLWVGWPGATVNKEEEEDVKSELAAECQAHPVFISEEDMDTFYLGFCNKTIWPLFHYFTARSVFDETYWKSYKQVNQKFCDSLTEIIHPGDVVWIHDYHLMLLPQLLRARIPEATIGFFLHIPFPSHEFFRILPREWSSEILEGILGADLVGFHTPDYSENFLRCVLRVLGREHKMGSTLVNGRVVKTETFPMGIDFEAFYSTANSVEVQKEKEKLSEALRGAKGVVSIDRLDYTKGVINRLGAFELFLERNPHFRRKVALMMVVVPSRIGVEDYQRMKRQIDEEVGRINGKFGDMDWTPILYQYRSLPMGPLVALYSASDVALVTPLRDGMNLVAKEYVATRTEQTGVLILSEMAGAANELGEALLVNPYHVEDIAGALVRALEMSAEEQMQRNRLMQARLRRQNVTRWADDFIRELVMTKNEQEPLVNRFSARNLLTV